MGFAALSAPTAAEAVLVLDVDELFRRLPAAARAKVIWTKPRLDAGLKRLRTEPLTDALLDEVARELAAPMRAVGRAGVEFMVSNRDAFRTSVMDDLRREEDRLRGFLPDDDTRDTLSWVLGFLRSFFGVVLAFLEPEHLVDLDDKALAEVSDDREFGAFMRAQVALMAAVEAAKEGVDPDRCASLTDAAFIAFMAFRSSLREQGVWLSPFPNETSEERRESLLRYASRLRETLTDQDWQTLDGARMGNLR